jgi:hypothetical protein
MGGRRGENQKGSDYSAIPLCREHHSELESVGRTAFEAKYRTNVWKVAWALFVKWMKEKGVVGAGN